MDIALTIDHLKGLISFFKSYKKNGITSSMILAKEIAEQMNTEPKFHEKYIIRRKKQFDEIENEDIKLSVEKSFRINYFTYLFDHAISSLQNRFEQFKIYEDNFSFLYSVKKLKLLDDILKKNYLNLENFLKHDMLSNIDGLDLFS